MRVDLFDFELPQECIALRPMEPREAARLLVVHDAMPFCFADRQIADLPDVLAPGDMLVFNDTRVIPARLKGVRIGRGDTTPRIEATLHKRTGDASWLAFCRPARKLETGDRIAFGDRSAVCHGSALDATVKSKGHGGEIELGFDFSGNHLDEAIVANGSMPLPPYIASRRGTDEADASDYQTIFARPPGAVAAPTAGLHFTEQLLGALEGRGIQSCTLTLHVGAGTFLPVKCDDTDDHKMHAEWGEIPEETASRLNQVRRDGGRVVAVGTTSLRLLESASDADGVVQPFAGDTDIFMTPGYRFKCAELLLTNFHLPRSTLFMLVSAFAGLERMKAAYAHAIAHDYRFYSYGDACLLSLSDCSTT